MSADVEKLLRQEHIRQEDLLTDGPNNDLNQQIYTEETTVGNTKGKKTEKRMDVVTRVRRSLIITNHEDVLRIFHPIIVFGFSTMLFIQMILAVVISLLPSIVTLEN